MKPNINLLAVLLLISTATCDVGVKTARHAYSGSSSGSNSFAGSYSGSNAGSISGNPAFWWAGADSPFSKASEYFARCAQKGDCGNIPGPFPGIPADLGNNLPNNGCNDDGCSFSGSYNIHDKQQAGSGQADRSKNPFLNGEFQGIAVSSCSGSSCPGGKPQQTVTTTHCKGSDCKTNTQHGAPGQPLNTGQNPFLNGAFGGSSSGSYGGSGSSGCSGVKGGCKGGQGSGAGCGPSGCSYPQGGSSGSGSFSGSGSYSGSQGSTSFVGQTGQQPGQFGQPGQNTQFGQPGQSPPLIGGCAGTLGGCKPGQNTQFGQSGQSSTGSGSFSGSGSYAGSQGSTSFVGGCAGVKGGCKPGQNGQQPEQFGQPGQSGQPPVIGGCAGTLGGCKSGQNGQFGPPGQNNQPDHFGQSPPIIGGCAGTQGGCKPGQYFPGSTTGSFSGSTSGSGSYSGNTHTSFAQQGPGYSGTTFQPSGSQPSYTSGPQGGQPSYTSGPQQGTPSQPSYTSGPQGGSPSGSQPTYTSGPQQGTPSQPSYTSGPQGGSHGQPSYTSGPQTGFTSGSTSGSFSGSSSGSHSSSGSFSGAGSTTGTYNQPGYTSGSQPGSTSFGTTGSFGGSGSYGGKTTPGGGNREKCYGEGLTCVEKHLCVNGIINVEGDGLLNVRDGDHFCDTNTEICCKLPNKSGRPYEDRPIVLPGGQTIFQQTTNSQHSSSASSSSSSSGSSTSSFGSTTSFGTSPRFTPGPGSKPNYVPGGSYQPGQTINLPGRDGQSPGVIQVVPDNTKTQAPDLKRPQTGLQEFGPGQAPGLRTTPGLQEFAPGQAPGLRTTPSGVDVRPHGQNTIFDSTAAGSEVTNDITFASTIRGPAYLPPGPSPSPSSYTPDLLPPNRYSPPSTQKPSIYYTPPTTSPRPSTYYPAPTPAPTNFFPPQKQTPDYLPPSPTQTPPRFIPTTRKPQVTNGYLPPQEPSATVGDNQYLPPPSDPSRENQPDSNIINISVIPPDRVPDGTNGDPSVLRPTTARPRQNPRTDFPQNTTPYPGCAAALKCVAGDFCTAEGVISKTRVLLTPEQEINRVPTTECADPETGIIGRCCRDPDYKDPWPSTQLGLFNPDQAFQGTSQNPGFVRPKPPPGVKGGRRPYEPNQIGAPSNNPSTFIRPGYPTVVPNTPFDSRLVNRPQQVDFKPPVENRFDSSNKFPQSQTKNPESCGVRRPGGQPSAQGPIDASFGEIPWQAMILRDTNRSLLCGGAIIRRDAILTTASCVEGLRSDDVLVKGGEWKLGIDDEPKPFQINKVETIVRHPGYNPQNKLNDVAILILKEKFRLDRNVDTLCLPDPGEDIVQKFQGAKCITTGWGKTILQLHIQNAIMHILGVGILPGGQCQQQLQQYHSESANLYNTNCVCGVPTQPDSSICDVDIGSALACEGPDGRYTLAGIYSWDTGCNPTAQVAGYSRVDAQWVSQTLQRPIKDLKTEEAGFYQQLTGQECHCIPGK